MNYLIVVSVIGLVILIHELGHLLAAKWMKIPVSRFSIGFGKRLWGFKKGDTEYWISIIPLGGYVLPTFKSEKEFFDLENYKRIIFTLGGPLANIMICVFLFSCLNLIEAGFSISNILIMPVVQTLSYLAFLIIAIPGILSNPSNLTTIIDLVRESNQVINYSITRALQFSIMLNIHLALINMLPVPPLDGGKLLLYLIERVDKRLIRLHLPVNLLGWAMIIGLIVYLMSRSFINMIA